MTSPRHDVAWMARRCLSKACTVRRTKEGHLRRGQKTHRRAHCVLWDEMHANLTALVFSQGPVPTPVLGRSHETSALGPPLFQNTSFFTSVFMFEDFAFG